MGKTLAVGDIHCKFWIIDKVMSMVDNYDSIIFIGDYADNWSATPQDSIETWKKIKEFQEDYPSKVEALMGNHDYSYVAKTQELSSGYKPITQLLINMPENKPIKDWVASLPIVIEKDGVHYSHAGITEVWDGLETLESLWWDGSPLWARPWESTYKEIPQVFGHTPSATCYEVIPRVWCIDTFSTNPDGSPVGDYTVLEITDGKEFNKVKL